MVKARRPGSSRALPAHGPRRLALPAGERRPSGLQSRAWVTWALPRCSPQCRPGAPPSAATNAGFAACGCAGPCRGGARRLGATRTWRCLDQRGPTALAPACARLPAAQVRGKQSEAPRSAHLARTWHTRRTRMAHTSRTRMLGLLLRQLGGAARAAAAARFHSARAPRDPPRALLGPPRAPLARRAPQWRRQLARRHLVCGSEARLVRVLSAWR